MSADQQRQFPGWDAMYQQQAIETMPWFYPELDDDLRQALDRLGLRSGDALDLGTGPGIQAMQLARRGFAVTAADISEAAIRLAREKAEAQGLTVTWQQDDILSTRLTGLFDLIFDRGCFHVLPPGQRPVYISTIAGLLKPGGYLFLKCFSQLQPGTQGPQRFTPEQIREIFGSQLQVHSVEETVYQRTLDPLPRALFCVLQQMSARLLHERTGQDLDTWNQRITSEGFTDEQTLRAWLTEQGVTGYAQSLLVMERFGYPAFFLASADELIEGQYADRSQLRPIFDAIIDAAAGLGEVVVQTRKTYVSLVTPRRTFARIQPTTRQRVDLGLRLEGQQPGGRLQPSKIHETMPLHISLTTLDEIDAEVLGWLQQAYEQNC